MRVRNPFEKRFCGESWKCLLAVEREVVGGFLFKRPPISLLFVLDKLIKNYAVTGVFRVCETAIQRYNWQKNGIAEQKNQTRTIQFWLWFSNEIDWYTTMRQLPSSESLTGTKSYWKDHKGADSDLPNREICSTCLVVWEVASTWTDMTRFT